MKIMKILLIALFLAPTLVNADAISDIAVAKCVKCHSPTAQFPRIDGQHPEYAYKTLIEYKNKVRKSDMMVNRVTPYDPATLQGLAEYFSRQTPATGKKGDATLIAAGKALYENQIPGSGLRTCSECHGNNGEGRGFGSGLNPRLAGQISSFTKSQFALYKAGTIPNQPDMTQVAQKLTADQVKALAEYIQSL